LKISLGWITRKRTPQLIYSICSFVQNANNPQDIELIISVDNDDKETIDAIKGIWPFLNISRTNVQVLLTERYGYDHMDKYHRNAGGHFTGDCFIMPSDDVFCLTQGWDDIVKKEVEPYINEPALIQTQPVEDRSKFWPTMPGITKKWWEVTKNIMCYTAGDIYLANLVKRCKLRTIKPDYEVRQISRIYYKKDNWLERDDTHFEGRDCKDEVKSYLAEPYQKRRSHKEDDGIHTEEVDVKNLMKWKKDNGK